MTFTYIRPKIKKRFGCTLPTEPMFEDYPNIFYYLVFKFSTKKLRNLPRKDNKMMKKIVNTDADTGQPAIKSLHAQRRVSNMIDMQLRLH